MLTMPVAKTTGMFFEYIDLYFLNSVCVVEI